MQRSRLIKIEAFALIFAFLLSNSQAVFAQSTIDLVVHYVEGLPAENEIAYDVNVYLSVVDSAGNSVKDLTAESFTVTEDSQKVDVTNLELAKDEPINIVLVMDTSGSMSGTGITAAKTAASNFVAGLGVKDLVSVVTFDNTVKTQIDFTTDHNAAREQISLIEVVRGAGTCLYDAAYQAVQMASTLPSGRRAVILFTDGVDETPNGRICSSHTTDDVINIASEGGTRTPIYTLGMGNQVDTNTLKRLAELTGGRYLNSPDSSQLDAVFLRLSDQLRSQYIITYKSVAGPGAHTLAVSANYLNAQDSDTRNFLLPALPTRVTFTAPLEGQEVNGLTRLSVSISGQGEAVDRVAFEVNGEVVDTDDTTPYEIEVDLSTYSTNNLELSAIVYGANNAELARESITVKIADVVSPATPTPETNDNMALIIGGGVGGLIVVTLAIAAFFVIRRRRQEKARDDAWLKAQSDEGTPAGSAREDRTFDNWEISSDALGLLIVEASDDATMIGHRFEITSSLTTLGRSADNDINFPKDSPVSRHHAEISQKSGGLYLRELESADSSGISKPPTFGTFLNESPLGSDPILLQSGDEIRIGKRVRLKFEASGKTSDTESLTYDGLMSPEDPDKTQDQL